MSSQAINRTRFTKAFMTDLKKKLQEGRRNDFIRKYEPTLVKKKKGTIVVKIDGKMIVARHLIPAIIKYYVESGSGALGIRNLQAQINETYLGITRAAISNYLQSDPALAKIRRRPPSSTQKQDPPGKTEWVLHEKKGQRRSAVARPSVFDGINTVGSDLIEIDKSMKGWATPYKYIAVFVHKLSGFLWIYPLETQESAEVVKLVKKVFKSCRQKFGPIGHFETDMGTEYAGRTHDYLRQHNRTTHHITLKLVPYVERINSHIQRSLVFLREKGKGFEEALTQTQGKLRNVINAVTKMKPKDVNKGNVEEALAARGKRGYKKVEEGQRKQPRAVYKRARQNKYRKRVNKAQVAPVRRKVAKFKETDEVRVMRKVAGRKKGKLYKSYSTDNTMRTWGDPTRIIAVHPVNKNKYKVRIKVGHQMKNVWRNAEDLIRVVKRKNYDAPVPKPPRAPKPKPRAPKPKPRAPKPKPRAPQQFRQFRAPRGALEALRRKNKRKRVQPKQRGV